MPKPVMRISASQIFQGLENMADGVFIVDGNLRIQMWNKSAEKFLGFRKDEVEGRLCAAYIHVGVIEFRHRSHVPPVSDLASGNPGSPVMGEVIHRYSQSTLMQERNDIEANIVGRVFILRVSFDFLKPFQL